MATKEVEQAVWIERLGPRRFRWYDTRVDRKSLSLPVWRTRKKPVLSIKLRFGARFCAKYACIPQPAKTPIDPPKAKGSYPACSSASQAHSRKCRCCGSIIDASLGLKPKNSASDLSTPSRTAAALT